MEFLNFRNEKQELDLSTLLNFIFEHDINNNTLYFVGDAALLYKNNIIEAFNKKRISNKIEFALPKQCISSSISIAKF